MQPRTSTTLRCEAVAVTERAPDDPRPERLPAVPSVATDAGATAEAAELREAQPDSTDRVRAMAELTARYGRALAIAGREDVLASSDLWHAICIKLRTIECQLEGLSEADALREANQYAVTQGW